MPETASKNRIALIGVGEHAARNVLPAIRSSSSFDLTALVSRSGAATLEVGELDTTPVLESVDDLLESGLADCAYVATPNAIHHSQTMQLLRGAMHVICEKPLCVSRSEFNAVREVAQEQQLLLADGFMFLHHRLWTRLMTIIEQGELGAPLAVEASFGIPQLPGTNIRYQPELGGGAFLDLAGYPLRAFHSLAGGSDIALRGVDRQMSRTSTALDLGGAALVSAGTGMLGNLNWGMDRGYRNEMTVWLEQGVLRVQRPFSKPETFSPALTIERVGEAPRVEEISAHNQFVAMLDAYGSLIDTADSRAEYGEQLGSFMTFYFDVAEAAGLSS